MVAPLAAMGISAGIGALKNLFGGRHEDTNAENMRVLLEKFFAQNPFLIPKQAANLDAKKSWYGMLPGSLDMVDPNTLAQLGSTRPNTVGLNVGVKDYVKGLDLPKGNTSWWRKALGGALEGAGAGAAAFGAPQGMQAGYLPPSSMNQMWQWGQQGYGG